MSPDQLDGKSKSLFFGPLLVLGSMISLTVGASVAKSLFPVFGPAGTTFLRLAIGSILLVAYLRPWRLMKSSKSNGALSFDQWKPILLYGVILGIMNLTFYQAIARLPIGIAIAIEFLGPLSVSLYLSRTKLDFVWAILALIGIYLILPLANTQGSLDPIGVAYALVAAIAWATYIIVGRRAGTSAKASFVTAAGMSIACLTTLPFGIASATLIASHASLLPAALAVGLLSSAIPYSLEMTALKHIDAKNFGILLSLEPAIGALSAFAFINERLTALQCFAIACVICASVGSTIGAARKKPKAPQDLAF